MPAGKLVEWPGPAICAMTLVGADPSLPIGIVEDVLMQRQLEGRVVTVTPRPNLPQGGEFRFEPERLPSCLQCCGDRAALWSGEEWGKGRQEEFHMGCNRICASAFRSNR